MTDIKLGTLITHPAQRDAIHIAIAPVTSDESLYAGCHVSLVPGSTDKVRSFVPLKGHASDAVGIVDPFLTEPLKPGDRFWLLLYPQTITGLRHEWSHPAFPITVPIASEVFLRNYAAACRMEYKDFMTGVDFFLKTGQEMDDDMNGYEIPDDFWTHYQAVTGQAVPKEKQDEGFWSCCV